MKENTGREKQIERCKENKAAEVEIQKKKVHRNIERHESRTALKI